MSPVKKATQREREQSTITAVFGASCVTGLQPAEGVLTSSDNKDILGTGCSNFQPSLVQKEFC